MLPKIEVLMSDLTQKIRNDFYELNMKQLKWVSSVTIDYLRSVGLDLEAVSKNKDDSGNSLLHKLVQIRNVKPLKLLVSKFSDFYLFITICIITPDTTGMEHHKYIRATDVCLAALRVL